VFLHRKDSGYTSYLTDRRPKAKVVISPPKINSSGQPMDTGETANTKTNYLRTTFVACVGGGYGMRCKSKKASFSKSCILYYAALNVANA